MSSPAPFPQTSFSYLVHYSLSLSPPHYKPLLYRAPHAGPGGRQIRDGLRPLPPTPRKSLDTQQLSVRLNFLLAYEIGESACLSTRHSCTAQSYDEPRSTKSVSVVSLVVNFVKKLRKNTSQAFENCLRNPKMTSQKLSKALPEMPGHPSEPPEHSQPRPRALPRAPSPPFSDLRRPPPPFKNLCFPEGKHQFLTFTPRRRFASGLQRIARPPGEPRWHRRAFWVPSPLPPN